jgi:GGDEF domain-containing protein
MANRHIEAQASHAQTIMQSLYMNSSVKLHHKLTLQLTNSLGISTVSKHSAITKDTLAKQADEAP